MENSVHEKKTYEKIQFFTVKKFATRKIMGECAATELRATILKLFETRPTINMIFAAAPSQSEFLEAFRSDPSIDFIRINAFHMDEYVGLKECAPQRFGTFLKNALFDHVPFRTVNYLDGNAKDIEAECARYAELLNQYPVDIVCLGIGENGHIAFNDPHVADFSDPYLVKVVSLDSVCRQQQVNDGCFASLEQVPTHALTLTIPALTRAAHHFCVVPAATKADAVRKTVFGSITSECPASILRTCAHATLYVDAQSGQSVGEATVEN